MRPFTVACACPFPSGACQWENTGSQFQLTPKNGCMAYHAQGYLHPAREIGVVLLFVMLRSAIARMDKSINEQGVFAFTCMSSHVVLQYLRSPVHLQVLAPFSDTTL